MLNHSGTPPTGMTANPPRHGGYEGERPWPPMTWSSFVTSVVTAVENP